MSKQTTLFQTWGQKGKPSTTDKPGSSSATDAGVTLDDDEDDEQLLLAIAESLKDVNPSTVKSRNGPSIPRNPGSEVPKVGGLLQTYTSSAVTGAKKSHTATSDKQQSSLFSSFGNNNKQAQDNRTPIAGPSHALDDGELDETIFPDISNIPDLPGFDKEAGRMWIYPTNYPVREYQFNIIKSALFENTLVVLPTGLGKTFIAAVLMYNFYRWYPEGKVIFMAPTKPLVAQQIEACYDIMGIPQGDTAELTGAMQPTERHKSWQHQRVFFLTPQVMVNDLSRGVCPFNDVRCLVVDEAHKALGNHAYCQVVRELIKNTNQFRILCLSATPGSDIKAVQQVINNMLVSHVELRTEDMPDLLPYVHERKVDKIVVPLGEELTEAKEQYLRIIGPVVQRLKRHGVIYNLEPKSLSKFLIWKARDAFRMDTPEHLQGQQRGAIEGDFAMSLTMYHGYELLLQNGLRSLYSFLESVLSGEKGHPRTRTELQRSGEFNGLIEKLRSKFVPARALLPHTQATQNSGQNVVASGHPKLNKLEEVVVQHFKDFANRDDGGHKTRVMIFAQYRDSVSEITEILNRHEPLVRVMCFIGQSSAGKSTRGFTQEEQLKVMKMFREGGYNTLVSTCVGEEGLDIGDVDLIVCFDAHKSPIRLVQRMGRTGRKREGRIVMLMTEGKEEQIYNQSQCSKHSIHKAILNGTKSLHYYHQNPRMIPDGLTPACHRMHITIHTVFKPTNKSKAGPKKQQKAKITKLMDSFSEAKKGNVGTKASSKCDGFLTPAELSYWSQHFKMNERIPKLPTTKLVSLAEKREGLLDLEPFDPLCSTLRLNEWMLWQNRLQQTHKVSHSNQSKQLVELIGFKDLQEAIGEEDNYGQEMALFLNEEDVLPCGQTNKPGILRYCTPKGDDHKGQKSKATVRKKARKRSVLPVFDSDVEVHSDEELPGFDKIMQQTGKDLDKQGMDSQIDSEPDVRTIGSQSLAGTKRKSSISRKVISKTPARWIIKTPTGKKIWLNQGLTASQRKKLQSKKSVRLSQTQAEESCIKIIEDPNDVEDFSEYPVSEINPVLDAVREAEQLETEIEDNQEDLPPNLDLDDAEQLKEIEDIDTRMDAGENMELVSDELDEIFPDFFQQPSRLSQTKINIRKISVNQKCHIPAPPSLEKLDKLLSDLGTRSTVSPVNIFESAEKWDSMLIVQNGVTETHEFQFNGKKLSSTQKPEKLLDSVSMIEESEIFPVGIFKDLEDFNETMEIEENVLPKDKTPPKEKESNSDTSEKSESVLPYTTPNKQLSTSPVMSVSKMKPPRESSTPLPNSSCGGMLVASQRKKHELEKNKERLSGKFGGLGHDSFFGEDDDEMLAALVTQKPAMQSAVHDSKFNQSLFTFSQALMAVDSVNLESSSSEKTSSSVSPGPSCLAEKTSPEVSSTVVKHDLQKLDMKSPTALAKEAVAPIKTLNKPEPEVVQVPNFDLGFDFDDLDDSMVIPPSPSAAMSQSLSQKSLAGVTGVKSSQRSFLASKPIAGDRNIGPAKLAKRSSNLQSLPEHVPVMDNHFDDIDYEESFDLFAQQPNKDCGPKRSSFTSIKKRQNDVTVTTVKLIESNSATQSNMSPNFLDKDCSQTAVEHGMEVTETPETEFFDDMVEEENLQDQTYDQNAGDATSESLDESIIAAPKVRRKAAVLLSPSTPNLQNTKDDSTFKSPLAVPKRKGSRKAVQFLESSDEEEMESVVQDDDSDFDVRPEVLQSTSVKRSKTKKEKDKRKKKSRGRAFLDEEAELSGEEWSSDEIDCSQMNKFEASFVNDATQCSQQANVDMHAVYMESVRSPLRRGKFKLKYQDRPRMNVFSQGPPDGMSEYMQDSFCVDDEYDSFVDDEEYDEPESLGEISIVEEISKKKCKKPKKSSGKRKRIVMQSSSSSEEREGDHEMTALKERDKLGEDSKESNHRSDATVNSETVLSESDRSLGAKESISRVNKLMSKTKKSKSVAFDKENYVHQAKLSHLGTSRTSNDHLPVTGSSLSQNLGSSLASRCQQKLKSSTNQDMTIQSTSCIQPSSFTHVSANCKSSEIPVFSLGFDDLLGDEDFDNVCDIKCDTSKASSDNLTDNSSIKSTHSSDINRNDTNNRTSSSIDNAPLASKLSTRPVAGSMGLVHKSPDELRAERLRLSKLKQEQFRQGLHQKVATQGQMNQSNLSSINSPGNSRSDGACSSFALPNSSFTNKPPNKKISVLVDSREISGAQDIVSDLRSKHGLSVEVRQLGTCDYILSNRMAVERKSITDFTNGANRAKLLERIQSMCKDFERPCIVVEKDRLKPGEEKKNLPLLKSKYVENMLACLANTNIKVFFTDTQEETTTLFAELAQQEERKSFAIKVKLQLTPSLNQVLAFYQSLPRVSYITALNLMHNFKTINEFVHSVPGIIARRGVMPENRAKELSHYLKRNFDPQLISSKK